MTQREDAQVAEACGPLVGGPDQFDGRAFARLVLEVSPRIRPGIGGRGGGEDEAAWALGVSEAGSVEVLGFEVGDPRERDFWLVLLLELRARGLRDVGVVDCPDSPGLVESLRCVYPRARRQSPPLRPWLRYVDDP